MSQYNYTSQKYPVFENASDADNYGEAILADDFKTSVIDLDCTTTLDGELVAYASNQYLPPDISLPAGPNNDYHAVGYTRMSDKSYFDANNPINPVGTNGDQFNIDVTGARWIAVAFLNRVAGTIQKLSVTLFDNQ